MEKFKFWCNTLFNSPVEQLTLDEIQEKLEDAEARPENAAQLWLLCGLHHPGSCIHDSPNCAENVFQDMVEAIHELYADMRYAGEVSRHSWVWEKRFLKKQQQSSQCET